MTEMFLFLLSAMQQIFLAVPHTLCCFRFQASHGSPKARRDICSTCDLQVSPLTLRHQQNKNRFDINEYILCNPLNVMEN